MSPVLLLWLTGCNAVDWAWDRYVDPAPPPSTPNLHEGPQVRIEPPKPILAPLPATSDSRPEPPPPTIGEGNCDDVADGGPVAGPGCLTGILKCDQTVTGHTRGGVQRYDSEWYDDQQCTPATTDHDGGDERIYRLDVPEGDWTAFVTLESPCANLDLFGWLGDKRECPPVETQSKSRCESSVAAGRKREAIRMVSQHAASWYVVVEGVDDEEGLFTLSVQCRPSIR